jgi:hypothetical protein
MAYSSPGAMNTESALSPEAVRAAPQPLAARPYHRVHPGHRVHDDHGGRTGHQLFIHANPGDFVMPIVPPGVGHPHLGISHGIRGGPIYFWEHSPAGWSIAVMFGNETLAL